MAQLTNDELNSDKKPSDKQIQLAENISIRLRIDLPDEFTSYAYWKFINEHIEEWRDSCAECRIQRTVARAKSRLKRYGYNRYDSDFSVGDGLGIYDCYDFGANPWGNS
jgi:hypothetical protein